MNTGSKDEARLDRPGGVAALYLALAYLAAMPYFLLLVDYPSATTAAEKVALVTGNYASMYAMYIASYVVFGLALGVLALALGDRLRGAGSIARLATASGLLWAAALVGSGLVSTYGMTIVTGLAETAGPAAAAALWQAIEPVALALGGAGGELLGGLWVLLVSWATMRTGALPKPLGWLGALIGVLGVASVVPALHELAYGFGLLQIVWFAWLGVAMLRTAVDVSAARLGDQRADLHAAHAGGGMLLGDAGRDVQVGG